MAATSMVLRGQAGSCVSSMRCRPALAPRGRSATICRAEMSPEERDAAAEAQAPHWFTRPGVPPSSSNGSSGAGGIGSTGWASAADLHMDAEQPFVFSPDLDFPPVLVQDWRAFRARLVAMESGQAARAANMQLGREERWAHLLSQPERGCLLVARPRPGLGMFANTVILLLEHDDGEGSSGLVLNMPTPLMIGGLGLEEDIADAFGRCPLFIGGPVTKNLLHVLHGRRDVEGAMEIIEGVFAGGVESASELVRRGEASPQDFMLLAGYSGWGAQQLQQELQAGTWLVVAASQAVITDCLQESLAWNPNASLVSRMGTSSPVPSSEELKRQCWQRVLVAAGIDTRMLGML